MMPSTVECKYCGNTFEPQRKKQVYCGRNCKKKATRDKVGLVVYSLCITCKKEFSHHGEKITCSRECTAKYLSQTAAVKGRDVACTRQCISCDGVFSYPVVSETDPVREFCSLACAHGLKSEKKLTENLEDHDVRKETSERDGNACQLCGDCVYLDRMSPNPGLFHRINHRFPFEEKDNLITLCHSCYTLSNNRGAFWEVLFSGLVSGSKVVKKPWGMEIHVVNHGDYCLKYLVFFKGGQFSHHYHLLKKELWHCVTGKFECVLESCGKQEYMIFQQGDKIEIDQSVMHQLQAMEDSILVEVSTRDYPEDSIRVIKGIN